jgi:phosphopantetheinyl transferase
VLIYLPTSFVTKRQRPMLALAATNLATAETDKLVVSFATDDDRRASARHKLRQRQRQRLAARALVRSLLARHFAHPADSWKLTYGINGKPVAALAGRRSEMEIAISHSRNLVCLRNHRRGSHRN